MSATLAGRERSSAHLGATLRSILASPGDGFGLAQRSAARRASEGARPPEGFAPYVLGAIQGASLFLLWLKVSALVGLREESSLTFRWSFLVAAAVLGALLALGAQFLWGLLGARLAASQGSEVPSRDLRLVWGTAGTPHAIALILLPLDLVFVGSASFTSQPLDSSLASGWTAISVALGVALSLWSLFLLGRGTQVVSKLGLWRSVAVALGGIVVLALIVFAFRAGTVALVGTVL